MVRETIRKVIEHWPENETFALHGTPYGNVASIRKKGLDPKYGTPYICPFPPKRELSKMPLNEVFERAVGTALFSGQFSFGNSPNNPESRGGLPAILIFKGPVDWGYGRYDDDYTRYIFGKTRRYRSFGKVPESHVPPSSLVKVVRITPKEHKAILSKSKGDPLTILSLTEAKLTAKTLKAIRDLVLKKQKGAGIT